MLFSLAQGNRAGQGRIYFRFVLIGFCLLLPKGAPGRCAALFGQVLLIASLASLMLEGTANLAYDYYRCGSFRRFPDRGGHACLLVHKRTIKTAGDDASSTSLSSIEG